MPVRGEGETPEEYTLRLEAYTQILENNIKVIRGTLHNLYDAGQHIEMLIKTIKEKSERKERSLK